MPAWTAGRALVHYTRSVETVASILDNGFLLIPNRRELIVKFLDSEAFDDREPQQFGMVSFVELALADLASHRAEFGQFGVAVAWDWALANKAQRVIYLGDDGPVFAALRWLFQLGDQELSASGADPGVVAMGRTNKVFANMSRKNLYAAMLTLYEYMQPEAQSPQVEWRIVNDVPFYHDRGRSKAEIVGDLLRFPKTMRTSLAGREVAPKDVSALLCPAEKVEDLSRAIPARYRSIPIIACQDNESSQEVLNRVLERVPDKDPNVSDGKPTGAEGENDANETAAIQNANLSVVGWIEGLKMYPNELVRAAYLDLFYLGEEGVRRKLRVPAAQAAYLLRILKDLEELGSLKDSWAEPR